MRAARTTIHAALPLTPAAPRSPRSQDHRITLKAENPGLSFQDVGRQCGEKWRSLTDEEKAPYVKKAEVDKARYQREMEAYKKKQAESGAGDAAAADDAE